MNITCTIDKMELSPIIIENNLIGKICGPELTCSSSDTLFPRTVVRWKETINEWFNIPVTNQEWFKLVERKNYTLRPKYINQSEPIIEAKWKHQLFIRDNTDVGADADADRTNKVLILLKYFNVEKQTLTYQGSIWISLDSTLKNFSEKIEKQPWYSGRSMIITEEIRANKKTCTSYPSSSTQTFQSLGFQTGDILIISHEYNPAEISNFQINFFKNCTNFYTCPTCFLSSIHFPKAITCQYFKESIIDNAS
jgi:hypothetical protein